MSNAAQPAQRWPAWHPCAVHAHGAQVAYNGHLLYTFADDQAGQVTGQGVQGFFVATPGLTPLAGSSTTAGTAPAASS